jgi:hypothetical protein
MHKKEAYKSYKYSAPKIISDHSTNWITSGKEYKGYRCMPNHNLVTINEWICFLNCVERENTWKL